MYHKKICIINCYFGPLPASFGYWIESCKKNPTIDFLLFTDQNYQSNLKNIKIIYTTLDEIYSKISKEFKLKLSYNKPHKLCDFKPFYGLIFSDYLENYDYWGHCDLDMIFGDLRGFLTPDLLKENEKIYSLGHLSIYLNTEEVNRRPFLENDKLKLKDVIDNEKTLGYDELDGISNIYKLYKFSIYEKIDFADISHKYKRFKLSTAYGNVKNYKQQIFCWEDGKVFRYYIDKDNLIKRDEFSYIHFQKRSFSNSNHNIVNIKKFIISYNGLIEIGENTIIDENYIKKHNRYNGILFEKFEELVFNIKMILRGIFRKIGLML